MSLAETAAASCVLLTKVVVRLEPFHWRTEPLIKFEPITVRLKPAPPAVALEGDKDVTAGTGLLVTPALMVKDRENEVPPPGAGLNTVIWAVPAVPISLPRMAAVNCVLLTKVVDRLEPFHWTMEPETKFEPLTVSVNAVPPTIALEGDEEVIDGTGLFVPVTTVTLTILETADELF